MDDIDEDQSGGLDSVRSLGQSYDINSRLRYSDLIKVSAFCSCLSTSVNIVKIVSFLNQKRPIISLGV